MKPADLAIVNDLFACVAPVAAAEMKGRVLAVLRSMRLLALAEGDTADADSLKGAIHAVQALPLSKEATT